MILPTTICRTCKGAGYEWGSSTTPSPCWACGGKGYEVNVPFIAPDPALHEQHKARHARMLAAMAEEEQCEHSKSSTGGTP